MTVSASALEESGFHQGVDLAAKLRARLFQAPGVAGRDDYDLNPLGLDPRPQRLGVKAAVLVPVIAAEQPMLLFTRRTETLARHSGQVSFPGGRSEVGDFSPIETALREAHEEIGIAPALVDVTGYLSRYFTGTGFDIQPVVGVLAPGFALAPDPNEVAEIFQAPLAFFTGPANRRRETREWNGLTRTVYAFTYGAHEIWGATAAILVDLAERLAITAP